MNNLAVLLPRQRSGASPRTALRASRRRKASKPASDERTIDDALLTMATRAFGVAVANGYAKRLAIKEADGDDDALDIYAAKARVAALATLPVVVAQVEAAAEQIITEWVPLCTRRSRRCQMNGEVSYD